MDRGTGLVRECLTMRKPVTKRWPLAWPRVPVTAADRLEPNPPSYRLRPGSRVTPIDQIFASVERWGPGWVPPEERFE